MNNTRLLGSQGENAACQFLIDQGLTLVTKNFRTHFGEIDLIMKEKNRLVFVEVRFRKQLGFGSSCDTITYRKQERLIKSAAYYLKSHRLTEKVACRFDVIAIDQACKKNSIKWIKDAFQVK